MIRQAIHHGYRFDIDTSDWRNDESAEIASDTMIAAIVNLSPIQTARLWAEASHTLTPCGDEPPQPATLLKDRIERAAWKKAMRGYVSIPESGHNCEIIAAGGDNGEDE